MQDCCEITGKLSLLKKHKIKYVYGPPRGGCIFAVILSHKLEAKYLTSLKEKHIPENTLIIDDVSDTGKTLKRIINHKNYISATAFIKLKTDFIPNIYCRIVSNKIWIDYCWEQNNDIYKKNIIYKYKKRKKR